MTGGVWRLQAAGRRCPSAALGASGVALRVAAGSEPGLAGRGLSVLGAVVAPTSCEPSQS